MDRRYIEDQHIVARYLADQVTDEERAAFEAYYLEHPDMVQELEAAARFKAGLMHLHSTGELSTLLQQRPRRPQWQVVAATAAILLLVLAGLLISTRGADTRPLIAAGAEALRSAGGAVPAMVRSYAVLRTRGKSVDADIAPVLPGQVVELRVLPEFTATPARYRVRLLRVSADGSAAPVAQLGGLVPARDRFVSVFISGARLKPGEYELRISGDLDTDAANAASPFVLVIRKH
jgi:hypothetical protein